MTADAVSLLMFIAISGGLMIVWAFIEWVRMGYDDTSDNDSP